MFEILLLLLHIESISVLLHLVLYSPSQIILCMHIGPSKCKCQCTVYHLQLMTSKQRQQQKEYDSGMCYRIMVIHTCAAEHAGWLHLKVMTICSCFTVLDHAAQGYDCTCSDLGHEPCWDLPYPMEQRRLCAHDETCMMARQSWSGQPGIVLGFSIN